MRFRSRFCPSRSRIGFRRLSIHAKPVSVRGIRSLWRHLFDLAQVCSPMPHLVRNALSVVAWPGMSVGHFVLCLLALIGIVFGSLIHSVSRNPSLSKQLFGYAILGFALSEAMALFALLVAFLILFVLICCRHSLDFELDAVGFRGRDGNAYRRDGFCQPIQKRWAPSISSLPLRPASMPPFFRAGGLYWFHVRVHS